MYPCLSFFSGFVLNRVAIGTQDQCPMLDPARYESRNSSSLLKDVLGACGPFSTQTVDCRGTSGTF